VEERDRKARLSRFPHAIMLQVSYAELDFANRWCWQHFGPCDGDCLQRQSEYPMCDLVAPHSHIGSWTCYCFAKVDYNFGFNEWYFAEESDRESFLANVEQISWGEKYA